MCVFFCFFLAFKAIFLLSYYIRLIFFFCCILIQLIYLYIGNLMCPNPQDVSSEHHPSLVSFFYMDYTDIKRHGTSLSSASSTVHITNQIRLHVFELWLLGGIIKQKGLLLQVLPQPSKSVPPLKSCGNTDQTTRVHWIISLSTSSIVFTIKKSQADHFLFSSVISAGSSKSCSTFIVETFWAIAFFSAFTRIFSNCFSRQTSFINRLGRVIIPQL